MIANVLRALSFVAFAVLGIVWSGNPDDTVAALWVVSFALVAISAFGAGGGGAVAGAWERVGPSKDPADYR